MSTQGTSLFFSHAPHRAGSPILSVNEVVVRYQQRLVLDHLSFQLTTGERIAVVGPNGAGKTTLFKVIAGLLIPDQGDVNVFGCGPRGHSCIAYVVQRSQVDWTFPVTVFDVVMMGRTRARGFFRRTRKHDREFVQQCIHLVGMQELADRQIGELSGGQQQRMFIARALAQEAELMLMDEPFTGLDIPSQESILTILKELSSRHVTVVVATHDLNLASEHFDRIMLLNRKIFGLGKPDEAFTMQRLIDLYGGHAHTIATKHGTLMLGDTCCGGDHHA